MDRIGAWSLRRRLVVLVALLSAVGLMTAGVLTTAALRSYLLTEVDRQLMAASGPLARPGPEGGRGPLPGGPSNFYTQVSDATGTQTQVLTTPVDGSDTPPDLPVLDIWEVAEIAGQPFTVGSDGPDWRVIAWPLPDNTGSVMIATSLGGVQDTVTRLVVIQSITGLVIVGSLVLIGRWQVDRSLRPLTDVRGTASAIASGQLDLRVTHTNPATEVGALGNAFNSMLDRLQAAFEAQRESEAAARQSELRMRRFVADASHELRTPLTTVRGFAELHRMGALTEPAEVADALRRIEAESARMGVLVSDLLLLARLDQERSLASDDVDVAEVAEQAVAAAAAAWPDQRFVLTAQPAHVIGDADRLHQVLSNLLGNAARFSPAGQPVDVRVAAQEDGVLISVRDHGPGVPPEMAEAIFERFVRADNARARSDGGTGLGLSIVSAIVAGHNGRAWVEPADGGGARFVVVLPPAAPQG